LLHNINVKPIESTYATTSQELFNSSQVTQLQQALKERSYRSNVKEKEFNYSAQNDGRTQQEILDFWVVLPEQHRCMYGEPDNLESLHNKRERALSKSNSLNTSNFY